MEALAMAMAYATDAGLDLLTIDGAGGGTGMSPWNMMESWGVPSLELHSKAYEYARVLESRGKRVVDLAFGGGFAREDHIVKAMALGAPFTKLVCMGRAPMIPGFLGSNIEGVFKPEMRAKLNGHWDSLPASVKEQGETPEEIFAGWEEVKRKLGAEEMKKVPFGAVALFTWADKLAAGVQQFLAGARKFQISSLDRSDLMAANAGTVKVTGLPHMMEAQDEAVRKVLMS